MHATRRLTCLILTLGFAASACADPADGAPAPQGLATAALNGPTWLAPDADLTVPPHGRVRLDVLFEHHGSETGVEVRERWEAVAEPSLFAGASATLTVGARRFPTCGLSGRVFAGLRWADGDVLELELPAGDTPDAQRSVDLAIPADAAGPLELWLWTERADGCVEYDSNFGDNHRFEVFRWAPAVATFSPHHVAPLLQAPLVAGTALIVDYDISRLPDCRVSYRGFPSWFVTAYARFDDGPVLRQPLISFGDSGPYGTPDGSYRVMRPLFPVPAAATSVSLWFDNAQYPPTCQAWDSNGGQNHTLPIAAEAPPAPLLPLDPALAQGAPLKLAAATLVVTDHPLPYTMTTTLVGDVLVAALTPDKQVAVHVRTVGQPLDRSAQGGAWFDVPARYVGPVGGGYEHWRFEVPTALYKGGQGSFPLFRYAVRCTSAGTDHWDNHGGDDYRDGYLATPVQLLASTYTTTAHPSLYTMNHVLSGQILVDNLAPTKDVTVHYVGADGLWHDAPATYAAPSTTFGNFEVWTFEVVVPVFKAPPADFFRFAVRYRVAGAEHWDNHGGADYDGTVAHSL